jgi:hypothetical protein
MSVQSIFVLQIIADLIFVLVIFFLLARLRKSFDENQPNVIDQDMFLKLQDLIGQSQRDSERFLENLDASCQRFNRLALSLESREKRLVSLLEDIDLKREKVHDQMRNHSSSSDDRNYASIAEFQRRGLSVEEIAGRTGVPPGEIALILELEKLKKRE